jgi:hypothetical protein
MAVRAVLLLLAALTISYFIVTFCVEEAKALWSRWGMSRSK